MACSSVSKHNMTIYSIVTLLPAAFSIFLQNFRSIGLIFMKKFKKFFGIGNSMTPAIILEAHIFGSIGRIEII